MTQNKTHLTSNAADKNVPLHDMWMGPSPLSLEKNHLHTSVTLFPL